jgi:hypothetical protein
MGKSYYNSHSFMEPSNTTKVCREVKEVKFNQNGSHIKATFPAGSKLPNGKILKEDASIVYPAHETGIGLASKIFSFFKTIGLLCLLFLFFIAACAFIINPQLLTINF